MLNRYHLIRQYILKRNLLDTETDDEHVRRNEIRSSRLYLILLIIILYAFFLYTSLTFHITVITVSKPTIEQYTKLIEQFPKTLQCPCERISITYEEFLRILPIYHQICLSNFVSEEWIDYLFYENSSYYFQLDFRHSGSAQFQILRTLCQQAQYTIDYSLTQFYSMQFITNQLVSSETFDIQTNSFIELFKRTTPPLFLDILSLIRLMLIRHAILSGVGTSYSVKCCLSNNLDSVYPDIISYYETGSKYFSCVCIDSLVCKLSEGVYDNIDRYDYAGSTQYGGAILNNSNTWMINATFLLPGMFIGCAPTESLFYSTSECLYEETCLNQIGSHINYTSTSINSFSKLNQSLSTPKTTYETLINNLFIQEWIDNKSFSNYFHQCQPLYCQYTAELRQSWTSVLISTISLYGGLRGFLPFIILAIVTFAYKKRVQKTNVDFTLPKVSMKTRFNQLIQQILSSIMKINLFDSESTDEHTKRSEILSTRVYFIVLPILLSIFGIYIALDKQTKLITINNPTQNEFEQFKNNSVNNLQCPCSDISIKYNKFISFQPRYHQICSSIFVSTLWSDNTYWKDTTSQSMDTFQILSSSFFEFISILCDAANETVINSLIIFNENEYLTSETVSPDIFPSEITSFIELFKTTTQQLFKLRLNLIRRIMSGNQLIARRLSNTILKRFNETYNIEYHAVIRSLYNCSCATDPSCIQPMILSSSSTKQYNLLGIYQGCYYIQTVLLSTTECFFSENCINSIKSFMKSTEEVYKRLKPLNMSILSQYQTNTSMEIIVNNLFVEDWNEIYSFTQYYDQCQPSYCSYTIEQKPNYIDILTKLISIYGGLTIIIKIFIPIIINYIRRKKTKTTVMSLSNRIHLLSQLVKTKLLNLNLFKTRSINNQIIEKQRYTTRFYISISIVILPILIFYTLLDKKYVTITVKLLSLNQYKNLQMKYPTTINCPCTDISIGYNQFIELNPYYHQVCSSSFVSQEWIDYLYDENRTHYQNFRATASAQFQILSSLCKQAQETVNISLTQFYSTKLTSAQLISSELLQIQVDSIVNSFKKSLPQTFKQTLAMLSGIIQGNALITAYESNWKFTVLHTKPYAPIYTNPQSYGNSCNCATSSKCSQVARLNDDFNSTLTGLLIGCYPLESMLQSSLECLYNRKCLNLIINFIGQKIFNENMKTLNSSLLSPNFIEINETIQQMVDRLFVNEWYINCSHESYFKQCRPLYCIYSYVQNSDILYIITTVVRLYGGFIIILKMLSKFIIHIALWIINRRRTQVVPFPPSVNQNLQ